jgi:uncharacterized protein YvpB
MDYRIFFHKGAVYSYYCKNMLLKKHVLKPVLFSILSIAVIASLVGATNYVNNRNSSRAAAQNSSADMRSPNPTPGEVLIRVPIIEQPEQYACNVTATAIVLGYHGVSVDPMAIYEVLPKQNVKQENGYWGNPNLGYVGNIYGEFGGDGTKGYGVHWDPIHQYISQYRPAEVKRDWDIKSMLEEVRNGHVSIIWWQNGAEDPTPLVWKTYDANGNTVEINAVNAMHSVVVIGYLGSPESPSKIIVSDPWASRWDMRYAYYDIPQFARLWSYYQNTAVLVR